LSKRIKTRETHRNIKALDKTAVATERMKDSFVRSKESAAMLSEEGHGSPSEYAGDQVQYAAQDGARDAARFAAEQGKKLAVKGREAVRDRSAEASPEAERHFFGMTPEEPASGYDVQTERARLYAKQTAQTRDVDPQRQPKTLDRSVGRQPTIKTPETAYKEQTVTPTEQGRQFAMNRARIKAKETQTASGRTAVSTPAEHVPAQSVEKQSGTRVPDTAQDVHERTPMEQGKQLAIDRAKAKSKETQIARRRESIEKSSELPAYRPGGFRNLPQTNGIRQRQRLVEGGRVNTAQQDSVKTIRQRDRTVRRPARYLRRNGGRATTGSRRFVQRKVKTTERTSHAAIKTAQVSAVRARQAAQSAAVTARRSAQAARAAKVAAATTAKAVSKAGREMAQAVATSVRSVFAAIAAGGTVSMVAIVLILLIALIAGSCFGVVFASEDSGTGLTMQSAVSQINGDLASRIEKIKGDYEGEYDKVELVNADSITNWPDVIAIYAVKLTTGRDSPEEVATMTQKKLARLREICWDMNPLSAKLVEGEESTVLQITMTPKSYTDMMEEYAFTDDQRKMVKDLIDSGLLDKYKNLSPSGGFVNDGDFTAIEGTGGYIWPLQVYTRTSSPFGYRICPFHGRELHGGVDIPAPYGTSVHAAKSGTVVLSRYGSSYGNYIVLAHGDGTRTLYAHMSARLISPGQTVSQGQTIGRVGSTGSSTGNHLHFETWTGSTSSTRVNPMLYF